MPKTSFLFSLLFAVSSLNAAVMLTNNGQIACSIVLSESAGPVEQHAASELAKFLAKISGCPSPDISSCEIEGKYPVRLQLVNDPELSQEGFLLDVRSDSMIIGGRQAIGILYGVYEVLKKYGGIRWLVPGEDGEYFFPKPTIAVLQGKSVSNPSFEYRSINWGSANINSPKWDSFDWMVRNNLRIFELHQTYLAKHLHKGLRERGAEIQAGGHCFSDLLGGNYLDYEKWSDFKANLEELYQTHPDYFPLINGKRVFLDGHKYQPCTSNPEVIRIMSENLLRYLHKFCSQSPAGRYRLVNNDGTGWCQCENCQKIDRGSPLMVNRYWTFINELGNYVFSKEPAAIINTIAYQNFEAAPTEIFPDQRFATVELSFNRICYRHAIDDPECLTNKKYRKQYLDWEKLAEKQGYQLIAYAQIDACGAVFMPIEDLYIADLKYYHKHAIRGLRPQLPPVDGVYQKHINQQVKECWYAMWQTLYLYTLFAWDIDQDYERNYEEINMLYYGKKAWEGGMRDFRKLLSKTFQETPGCFGHGHSSPLGRCLDKPGVQEELVRLLNSAGKAAAAEPDKRALVHVQRERSIFARTWEKFRRDYLKNYREVRSYRKTAPIQIDGQLAEADWKNADIISNFKLTKIGESRPAEQQTSVRVVYEPDNIYFGIEAMEPFPDKLLTAINQLDGPVWEDNTLEIFLTHPDLGNAYYQLIFNAKGVLFDQFVKPGASSSKAFSSGAEVGTAILNDRWILEVRIPTDPLGEKCFDGQIWKVNVLRARKLKNIAIESGTPIESSTWSIGAPHDTGAFLPVHFAGKRAVHDVSRQEIDTRMWKNGSFSELEHGSISSANEKELMLPKNWSLSGKKSSLELLLQENCLNNYFVKLKSGILLQHYGPWERKPSPENFSIHFRAKGKGELEFLVFVYTYAPHHHLRSDSAAKVLLDSDEWKYYKFEYRQPDREVNISGALRCNSGEICFDDVFFTAAP
ncbi:MAG: DUF4838 domain-containing protein [Lentisphaeria bacterium]